MVKRRHAEFPATLADLYGILSNAMYEQEGKKFFEKVQRKVGRQKHKNDAANAAAEASHLQPLLEDPRLWEIRALAGFFRAHRVKLDLHGKIEVQLKTAVTRHELMGLLTYVKMSLDYLQKSKERRHLRDVYEKMRSALQHIIIHESRETRQSERSTSSPSL